MIASDVALDALRAQGKSTSPHVIARALDCDQAEALTALEELANAGVVQRTVGGRYRVVDS